jgi:hypothetical protein
VKKLLLKSGKLSQQARRRFNPKNRKTKQADTSQTMHRTGNLE